MKTDGIDLPEHRRIHMAQESVRIRWQYLPISIRINEQLCDDLVQSLDPSLHEWN